MLVRLKYYHTEKRNLQDKSFEDYYFRTVERLSLLSTLMNFVLIIISAMALAFQFYWLLFILLLGNKHREYISKQTFSCFDCTLFWLPF